VGRAERHRLNLEETRPMRIFTIDRSTLSPQDLQAKLFKADPGGDASLQALQALNPQVDFTRLSVGTVLLVPDSPGLAASAGRAAAVESFDTLGTDFDRALEASRARIANLSERSDAAQKALAATLRPAAVKASVKADPELQKQLDAAADRARSDAKVAAENLKVLEKAHALAQKELAALAKLFG
jgi:hypothetical protein